jgi:hypothetical protein
MFWKERSPCFDFKRLYSVSNLKEAKISDVGYFENGRWIWKLEWRRSLFEWEKVMLVPSGSDELNQIVISPVVEDRWHCNWGRGGEFCVKKTYKYLVGNSPEPDKTLFLNIWSPLVPFKISAFIWKLVLDGVPSPTKEKLNRRGVITAPGDLICALFLDS